jgi:hypothetical protein
MGKQYLLYKKCLLIRLFTQVMHEDWTTTFEAIKVQCSHVVMCSTFYKLEQWFPNQELMNAMNIIYFQY